MAVMLVGTLLCVCAVAVSAIAGQKAAIQGFILAAQVLLQAILDTSRDAVVGMDAQRRSRYPQYDSGMHACMSQF